MAERRLRGIPLIYLLSVLIVIFFAFASAYLEYYYVLVQSVPYREARQPVLGNFYSYDFVFFLPLQLFFAFQPIIYQFFAVRRSSANLRRLFALGLASSFLGLILRDASWFLFRTFAPLSADPLGHQWIRPSDYTSSVLGYAIIFGLTVPLWYIALLPPIIAIFVSLLIAHPSNEETGSPSSGNKPN